MKIKNISGDVIYSDSRKTIGSTLTHIARTGVQLLRADLSYLDLSNLDLVCINLPYARFDGVNLTNTNLAGANLICASFDSADITGAMFHTAKMARASLSLCVNSQPCGTREIDGIEYVYHPDVVCINAMAPIFPLSLFDMTDEKSHEIGGTWFTENLTKIKSDVMELLEVTVM